MNNQREHFLALCLVEAVEDENLGYVKNLLSKYGANPNTIIINKEIAPIHLAVGGDNLKFSEAAVEEMLKHGGDPNIQSEEGMTPLHVAANFGRLKIVELFLNAGADVDIVDEDNMTATLYAIVECHYSVVKLIQQHVFERKIEKKKEQMLVKCFGGYLAVTPTKGMSALQRLDESKMTPNRVHYNFDVTSPYYINITHRRNNKSKSYKDDLNQSIQSFSVNETEVECQNSVVRNLFDLTEDNLQEFSKNMSGNGRKSAIIYSWRDKVAELRDRNKLSTNLNDIEEILSKFSENSMLDDTFQTANEEEIKDESKIIDLIEKDEVEVQDQTFTIMTEEYVHTDVEEGIVFYEKKFIPASKAPLSNQQNISISSQSTAITVPPLDYDTDVLRAELTQFGEPPGPITKSTKKLYLKKLIRYKKDPNRMMANKMTKTQITLFSVELQSTIRDIDRFQRLQEFVDLENQMTASFNIMNNKRRREGHIKTSFIYLLIDPRISENLPGQQKELDLHDTWKKFLSSIFYVGKGKCSRPYSHLYDAMKLYSQKNDQNHFKEQLQNQENNEIEERVIFRALENFQKVKSSSKIMNRKLANDSEKLNKIIEVWHSEKGVVCLHVFHNIMPEEAYTREAAIIECIGLQNLTNLKKGDFYGVTKSWPMRMRKHLGVLLLFKAMQIFLAEGESQLMPSDLI